MKLLMEQWRQYLIEGDSKMDAIDIEKAKESSSEEWLEILNRFPEGLQKEIIDERPNPNQEDIDWFGKWQLVNQKPQTIPLKTLLQNEHNEGSIERTPKEVVDTINKNWDMKVIPDKTYDPKPTRYFDYAKDFSGDSALPSVMVDGEIVFGVGRFIAALIRHDDNLKVWEITTGGTRKKSVGGDT